METPWPRYPQLGVERKNHLRLLRIAEGTRAEYRAVAAELGIAMAKAGFRLVYGGAHVGLMGAVADAVLAGGGEPLG